MNDELKERLQELYSELLASYSAEVPITLNVEKTKDILDFMDTFLWE